MTRLYARDSSGIAAILKSAEVAAMVNSAAARLNAACDGEVTTYTTDRAAASVRVPAIEQARDGNLTRAAASMGLDVRAKR